MWQEALLQPWRAGEMNSLRVLSKNPRTNTTNMKYLKFLKPLCGFLYHRFGYNSDKCARCGIDFDNKWVDGCIISSEYDS